MGMAIMIPIIFARLIQTPHNQPIFLNAFAILGENNPINGAIMKIKTPKIRLSANQFTNQSINEPTSPVLYEYKNASVKLTIVPNKIIVAMIPIAIAIFLSTFLREITATPKNYID
jgi:hypothetical protein